MIDRYNPKLKSYKDEFKMIKRKTRVSKCLFSSFGNCSSKIIRAHSIQNNKILKYISQEGEVMNIGTSGDSFLNKDLNKSGRKIATTFSGFCAKHDTEIFSSIENKDYNMHDEEQEFIFAYRSLCKEIIAKEEQKNIFEYLNKEKKGLVDLKFTEGIKIGLSDLYRIKDCLDKGLQEGNFNLIETIPLELDGENKFAVSSIFFLEYDFKSNAVNNLSNIHERAKPLFLTVFPQNNKIYILFSYLKEDKNTYDFLNNQIIKLSRKDQTERISLLITLYCENFVYSPEKWEKINKNNKEEFMDLFEKTMFMEKLNYMDLKPPINFFE